jgi:hypothetical protein
MSTATPKKRPQRAAPVRPALTNVVTPVTVFALWTQEQAAGYLNVSTRYLRDSACPKVQLPGNGPKRAERVVRYRPEDVIEWANRWSTAARAPKTDGDV